MSTWWRAHSLRRRLTLGHVAAMLIVLAVYMTVIYVVVANSASRALNQQIRGDFTYTAAFIYRDPDGTLGWMPEELSRSDDEFPWVQVWSEDAKDLLFQNIEAQRRPLPGAQELAKHPNDERFVAAYRSALTSLHERGARATLASVVEGRA